MKALNILLAVVVSLALGLGVFNLGLSLLPMFAAKDRINEFDPKLGWSKKPNYVAENDALDVTFEINALGLRDDPMATPEKPANTFRVMMLGDSFVLGFTVNRENLFVDHLERWWASEERRVDVINAGTEGYSTDQEVLWFLEHGADYAPDVVLLFPYENDIYWNGQTKYQRYPKPRFTPDGELETGTLADPGRNDEPSWAIGRFLKMLGRRPAASDQFFETPGLPGKPLFREWAPLLKEEPPFLADCLARTKGALIALRDECRALDARLIMVPIPSESVVHAEERESFRTNPAGLNGLNDDLWSPNRPVDLMLELAREVGIESLDPRTTLKEAGKSDMLYFGEGEWHFNAKGNEVFARYLHDNLDGLGVFPEAHGPQGTTDFALATAERGTPKVLIVFGVLWAVLGTAFCLTYRDEAAPIAFLKVGGLLALVFALILGLGEVLSLSPTIGTVLGIVFVVGVLGFVAFKLGRRLGTIFELLKAFTLRGHWYLMPLVVVLLSIGSLLVVAASSPLVAPFIYTLF